MIASLTPGRFVRYVDTYSTRNSSHSPPHSNPVANFKVEHRLVLVRWTQPLCEPKAIRPGDDFRPLRALHLEPHRYADFVTNAHDWPNITMTTTVSPKQSSFCVAFQELVHIRSRRGLQCPAVIFSCSRLSCVKRCG